jgi:alkyl hydroperoxide reductase subunit AhpC
LLAVSADSQATLGKTVEKAKVNGGIPFPLVADGSRETFRAYRAYDGFEQVPLHGVFLVDGAGLVRWQDISHEPFTDVRFLLTEAKRQLLWQGQSVAGTPKASGTPGGQP